MSEVIEFAKTLRLKLYGVSIPAKLSEAGGVFAAVECFGKLLDSTIAEYEQQESARKNEARTDWTAPSTPHFPIESEPMRFDFSRVVLNGFDREAAARRARQAFLGSPTAKTDPVLQDCWRRVVDAVLDVPLTDEQADRANGIIAPSPSLLEHPLPHAEDAEPKKPTPSPPLDEARDLWHRWQTDGAMGTHFPGCEIHHVRCSAVRYIAALEQALATAQAEAEELREWRDVAVANCAKRGCATVERRLRDSQAECERLRGKLAEVANVIR